MKHAICKLVLAIVAWGGLSVMQASAVSDEGLKLHYLFDNLQDGKVKDASGNGYDALLKNRASLKKVKELGVLDLGGANGYLDLGTGVGSLISSLKNFTISTYLFIDPKADITGNGNFVWTFSTAEKCTGSTGKYIAFRVNSQQFEQSLAGWSNESVVLSVGAPASRGLWNHVCYTQNEGTATLYINGTPVRTMQVTDSPASIGEPTLFNWLGKPAFEGDSYLKWTRIGDFRIYNRALDKQEVKNLTSQMSALRSASAQEAMHAVTDTFNLYGLTAVSQNLCLPQALSENVRVRWTSSNPGIIDQFGFVSRPSIGKQAVTVQLKAVFTCDGDSVVKTFTATVLPEKKVVMPRKAPNLKVLPQLNKYPGDSNYSSYLFAYFTGNNGDEEAIRFALSNDGLTYRALNGNKPVIASDTISQMKGVRDPHIYRGPDNCFYMVVTDMKAANGWNSNHAMVFLKSVDLINWSHSIVDIAALYPQYKDVNRVWAPQTIWDPKAGKYMIYWSQRAGNDPDVIYYAYANKDFTGIEAEPKVLFPYKTPTIDGDIVVKDGKYNLFFKTEGNGNGIRRAESDDVTGPFVVKDERYLQQTTQAVEGACVFRLISSDTYVLMYDVYANGRYEFTTSTDLKNFKVLNGVSMNFFPRHGTVIPITAEEAARLAKKWGDASEMGRITSASEQVKTLNIVIDDKAKTIFLPVKPGTNLHAFNPELVSLPGVKVTPAGSLDFSKGSQTYRFQLRDSVQTYRVTAALHRNPVLDGYYADPEILYSEKTGKYYLYPTSDGFPGWSGTYFKCFSSSDLENWKDEGVIIQLGKDVQWSTANAWAPCIVEKKINGKYRYFYYFCAKARIGVAVSDNPTGPFVDAGSPMIDFKPEGVRGGQEIDPDVFTDPVSGKSYFYWGNGYMAGAELNDDMLSVKRETIKTLTPDRTFREGVYVIYRKGVYYFMWSEDDTGSPNYKVRYATATSPLGPLSIPKDNVVIMRDDAKAIYGTGHHSVVQVPGKDEWYIVYHRLTRPKGITLSSPGYYREVCIDKMEFNADGSIKLTKPTLEGVPALVKKTSGR